jgi:hypothetical protein
MAAVTLTWTDLLNELNRDAAREQPQDVIQWGADWFQSRLKRDVSAATWTPVGLHRVVS